MIKNLVLFALIAVSCTRAPLQHTITDAEAECIVVAECEAMWTNGDVSEDRVCECRDSYINLSMDCQAAFSDLAVCLHQRGCSLATCIYVVPMDLYETCDFDI